MNKSLCLVAIFLMSLAIGCSTPRFMMKNCKSAGYDSHNEPLFSCQEYHAPATREVR